MENSNLITPDVYKTPYFLLNLHGSSNYEFFNSNKDLFENIFDPNFLTEENPSNEHQNSYRSENQKDKVIYETSQPIRIDNYFNTNFVKNTTSELVQISNDNPFPVLITHRRFRKNEDDFEIQVCGFNENIQYYDGNYLGPSYLTEENPSNEHQNSNIENQKNDHLRLKNVSTKSIESQVGDFNENIQYYHSNNQTSSTQSPEFQLDTNKQETMNKINLIKSIITELKMIMNIKIKKTKTANIQIQIDERESVKIGNSNFKKNSIEYHLARDKNSIESDLSKLRPKLQLHPDVQSFLENNHINKELRGLFKLSVEKLNDYLQIIKSKRLQN